MAASDLRTHRYDVVVIGAGGAGLRAAIEASAQKAKVGLVCKSLLGKAHTVMAEGGAAAALGHDARPEGRSASPRPSGRVKSPSRPFRARTTNSGTAP